MANNKNYLAMGIAIIGWGLSTIFIEEGLNLDNIDPYSFLFYRFFVSLIILTPAIIIKKSSLVISMMKNKWVWIIGFSEASGMIFQYAGQDQKVPAGLAALLSLVFLIIVPFLSPLVLNIRIQRKHFVAILIGIIGVSLIVFDDNQADFKGSTLGIVLLLLAAFSYAIYIVSTSRYTTIENKSIDIFVLFYIVLLIISLTSFLLMIFNNGDFIPSNENIWIWVILLAIFSTIIAFLAYFEAMKVISANTASVLLLLQMVVPFTVEFILGRRYSLQIWSGVLVLLLSMIFVVKIKD